jgi:hypothetical protein
VNCQAVLRGEFLGDTMQRIGQDADGDVGFAKQSSDPPVRDAAATDDRDLH